MFLGIIAALSFFSVYGTDVQFPAFSYNSSGYAFSNRSSYWQVVGQANEANRGNAQSLLERQTDSAYLGNLYEVSLTDSAKISTEMLAELLATLPMPNVAYVDLTGVVGADILCRGLSQNKTLRNLRVIFLDDSDVTVQGLKSLLGIEIPDNLDPEEQNYCLIRDMKARSMMYGIPIASLQISIKNLRNLNYRDVQSLDSKLSSKKWPIFYLNNNAPEMVPLLFQFRP